jgi:fructokinase
MTTKTPITPVVICYGEVLWDCLPNGLFLGGAPYNVAYHLKQQGGRPFLISGIGDDFLGEEILLRMANHEISTEFLQKNPHLRTGAVRIELDNKGDASYNILKNMAWDHIEKKEAWENLVGRCNGLVFGSLSQRTKCNRDSLDFWIAQKNLTKIFDINLRAPHYEEPRIFELIQASDWVKCNEEELIILSGIKTKPKSIENLLIRLVKKHNIANICVTRGGDGALLWTQDNLYSAESPKVKIKDTVGAGDSVMATLTYNILTGEMAKHPEKTLKKAMKIGAYVASQDGAQPDYTSMPKN